MSLLPESLNQAIDTRLTAHDRQKAAAYARERATNPETGEIDHGLANQYITEVMRRGAISHEVYVKEPLQWTAINFGLAGLAGIATAWLSTKIKALKDNTLAQLSIPFIASGATALIALTRFQQRYSASLDGGVEAVDALNEVKQHMEECPNLLEHPAYALPGDDALKQQWSHTKQEIGNWRTAP